MRRLGDLIERHVPELAELETDDTGLPIHQTSKQLIPRASENFYFFSEVATLINGQTFPVDSTMLNYTLLQPVGVCGLISPWNVPLMTATWKVAPCLALGNTAVLKMSELSPMTADRLGRLALEAGVPKGVLNIVHGHGSEAGDALVRHPDVRTISFTGGTATGQRIAERAGIKRLSMELGGKSPVLVFEDADQQRALDAALFTIFSINGERCTAGSRVFVQRSIYDRFAREFAERAARLIVGDPRDPDTNVGSMITRQHWEKVTGYIEIGRREGAVVAAGGGVPAGLPARVAKGNFVQPTVLTGVDNRMRVAQEEIFGPVVCLIPSTTRTRACGWPTTAATGWLLRLDPGRGQGPPAGARHRGRHGLRQQPERARPAPALRRHQDSGVGREGGDASLETFCEMKNVCISMGSHPFRAGACDARGGPLTLPDPAARSAGPLLANRIIRRHTRTTDTHQGKRGQTSEWPGASRRRRDLAAPGRTGRLPALAEPPGPARHAAQRRQPLQPGPGRRPVLRDRDRQGPCPHAQRGRP